MTPVRPTILHVDMDAFYASVEVRDDPSLAGLPVCVGGPADGRGVIAAASYEARRFGVHSAMPSAEARRLCPDLVLLPPDFERYTAASREVMAIFRSYTPLVEPVSLDEAYLDVAGCERLLGSPVDVGRAIQREILRRTALSCTVGVAPTKFLAKLASDLAKPSGFRVIEAHEARDVLDPLPVARIQGVGPRTAKRLAALGVETIGDLARRERAEVVAEFGASGAWIHDLAHGMDTRRVSPRREEKSHGMERTFPTDLSDRDELRRHLLEFCEEVAFGLRDKGLRGRTITLKARYSDFSTLTRTKTLDHPTNLGPRIYAVARELLERLPIAPLRLVGVQISSLSDVRAPIQESLFGDLESGPRLLRGGQVAGRGKLERATEGLDKLRRKYGARAVVPASLLGRSRARSGEDGVGQAGAGPRPDA